jgi:phosphohistidine phosphatase
VKALYVLRHGIAEELGAGMDDDARELTRKGTGRMKTIAKGLADVGVRSDVILTSPLVRAVQTARIFRKYCSEKADIEMSDLLKPDASFDELIDHLNRLDGVDSVAIVGHEPFLSGFVTYCLAGEMPSFVLLKKGGIASLAIDEAIKPGHCALTFLLQPEHLIRT